ncbi:MAG: hypothetical protein ACP5JG_07475 [Anaerolineae bacterium]
MRYAQAHADELALPETLRQGDPTLPRLRRDIPQYVDTCLESPDPSIARAADALARRLGRNLAAILLTLHRGDLVNREARSDWSDEAWARWRDVRRIWLGGGIVSGDLGDRLMDEARSALAEFGYGGLFEIAKSHHPQDMALIGASRYAPDSDQDASHQAHLCLDLGQTSVKRAIVHARRSERDSRMELTRLDWLPAESVAWRWRNSPDAGRDIAAGEVLDFVSGVIVEGYRQALGALEASSPSTQALSRHVAMSIAAYVRAGTLLGNGIYARMCQLGEDVRPLLAERVAEMIGWRPALHVIHDGTAAAALHAGTRDGAVIVIGTALGVGFPPATERGLRRISPDFVVTSSSKDHLTR